MRKPRTESACRIAGMRVSVEEHDGFASLIGNREPGLRSGAP